MSNLEINDVEISLSADDISVFVSSSDLETTVSITNITLRRLSEWFASNRLSLNINKTNFILFCPKQKKYDNSKLNIFIDDLQMKQITHTKLLGVQIDQNLTWNKHIDTVALKIAQNLGIIRRVKDSIPPSYLLTLYNTYSALFPTATLPGLILTRPGLTKFCVPKNVHSDVLLGSPTLTTLIALGNIMFLMFLK